MALPDKNRIRRNTEIREVLKNGRRVRGELLFVAVAKRPEPRGDYRRVPRREPPPGMTRFAFIVPAAVFKKAVHRNRIKRIFGQTVREFADMSAPLDIVIGVVKKAAGATEDELRGELKKKLRYALEK